MAEPVYGPDGHLTNAEDVIRDGQSVHVAMGHIIRPGDAVPSQQAQHEIRNARNEALRSFLLDQQASNAAQLALLGQPVHGAPQGVSGAETPPTPGTPQSTPQGRRGASRTSRGAGSRSAPRTAPTPAPAPAPAAPAAPEHGAPGGEGE